VACCGPFAPVPVRVLQGRVQPTQSIRPVGAGHQAGGADCKVCSRSIHSGALDEWLCPGCCDAAMHTYELVRSCVHAEVCMKVHSMCKKGDQEGSKCRGRRGKLQGDGHTQRKSTPKTHHPPTVPWPKNKPSDSCFHTAGGPVTAHSCSHTAGSPVTQQWAHKSSLVPLARPSPTSLT